MGESDEIERGVGSGANDDALARAARAGDREARNSLYLRHRAEINRRIGGARRLAARLALAGLPVGPEDVEQQAFIIFCNLVSEWDPERLPFLPYMLVHIRLRAYRYVRDSQHLRSRVVVERWTFAEGADGSGERWGEGEAASRYAGEPAAQEVVDGGVAGPDLEAMLGQLRNDWATFVRMRFWEGRTGAQIAEVDGRSKRSINRMIQAALLALRESLSEEREAL